MIKDDAIRISNYYTQCIVSYDSEVHSAAKNACSPEERTMYLHKPWLSPKRLKRRAGEPSDNGFDEKSSRVHIYSGSKIFWPMPNHNELDSIDQIKISSGTMNKVQGVSLPRTGHNMLVIHLKQYFADHVDCPKYKDFLIPPLAKRRTRIKTADDHRTPRFHYCEHYYSCRSIPCVDADNKFQKSHDFDLDLSLIHI